MSICGTIHFHSLVTAYYRETRFKDALDSISNKLTSDAIILIFITLIILYHTLIYFRCKWRVTDLSFPLKHKSVKGFAVSLSFWSPSYSKVQKPLGISVLVFYSIVVRSCVKAKKNSLQYSSNSQLFQLKTSERTIYQISGKTFVKRGCYKRRPKHLREKWVAQELPSVLRGFLLSVVHWLKTSLTPSYAVWRPNECWSLLIWLCPRNHFACLIFLLCGRFRAFIFSVYKN